MKTHLIHRKQTTVLGFTNIYTGYTCLEALKTIPKLLLVYGVTKFTCILLFAQVI